MGELRWRQIVALLVALIVAGVTLKVLVWRTYCLVPSTVLKFGEVGTAETSIWGFVLYRSSGTDHLAMYNEAVWWYETALWAEWGAAVLIGVGLYLLLRRWQERAFTADQPQTPSNPLPSS